MLLQTVLALHLIAPSLSAPTNPYYNNPDTFSKPATYSSRSYSQPSYKSTYSQPSQHSSTTFSNPPSSACKCLDLIDRLGQGKCTTTYRGEAWCYVAPGSSCTDHMIVKYKRYWSYTACKTEPVCKTVQGEVCQFQFGYNGKSYTGCTTDDSPNGQPWCPTQRDDRGQARGPLGPQSGWDYCGQGCGKDSKVEIRDEEPMIRNMKPTTTAAVTTTATATTTTTTTATTTATNTPSAPATTTAATTTTTTTTTTAPIFVDYPAEPPIVDPIFDDDPKEILDFVVIKIPQIDLAAATDTIYDDPIDPTSNTTAAIEPIFSELPVFNELPIVDPIFGDDPQTPLTISDIVIIKIPQVEFN